MVTEVIQNGKKTGYRWGETGRFYSIVEFGDLLAKLKAFQEGDAIQQSLNLQGRK